MHWCMDVAGVRCAEKLLDVLAGGCVGWVGGRKGWHVQGAASCRASCCMGGWRAGSRAAWRV